MARRRARGLGAIALVVAAIAAIAACTDKPSPLSPAPQEAGKKHCGSNDDCASGLCRENRCQ